MSRQEKPEGVTIALTGDVMLGRLVDQTLPHPFQNGTADSAMRPRVRAIAGADQLSDQELYERPWGDTKDLLKRADLTLINLETSITQHSEKWPAKVFNYRMHPLNAPGALTAAGVDFCSLANNHVLDFGYPGLTETLRVLELAGIAHTGAGENAEEVMVHAWCDHGSSQPDEQGRDKWAATASRPGINYINASSPDQRDDAAAQLKAHKAQHQAHLSIVELHIGPNYAPHPVTELVGLAHCLVDKGDADVIIAHSAHHMQGVQIYRGVPIIFGAGDFLDDYAVDDLYRNDLAMLYVLHLDGTSRRPTRLDCLPTKISNFGVHLLKDQQHPDFEWTSHTFQKLCSYLGSEAAAHNGIFSFYLA